MKRGEIWWSNQPTPIGKRPVLLLSRDEAYAVRNAVTIAQITTTIRNIPVEVALSKMEGLSRDCVVNVDTLTTIPKNMLSEKISTLSAEKMEQVNEAVRFALALA